MVYKCQHDALGCQLGCSKYGDGRGCRIGSRELGRGLRDMGGAMETEEERGEGDGKEEWWWWGGVLLCNLVFLETYCRFQNISPGKVGAMVDK